MKQSKFNTDATHLIYIGKWDHLRGDWRLLFCPLQCFSQVRLVSRNAMKCFTAHRPEETICCFLRAWSIHCLLSYCLWLEAGGYFSLDNFNILWPNWYCANKWSVKTNAWTRQDLYNSKQHRFGPTRNERASEQFQVNFARLWFVFVLALKAVNVVGWRVTQTLFLTQHDFIARFEILCLIIKIKLCETKTNKMQVEMFPQFFKSKQLVLNVS